MDFLRISGSGVPQPMSPGSDQIRDVTGPQAFSSAASIFNSLAPTDSGPILYMESNRTSAIEDIRNVIIYISFATLLLGFLIIFPGIRHDKIPTFLCIPTSLVVTCIIFAAMTGTTWHVGEAPISAAYKAFSRDRIQGELRVRIGLQSVNITLRAHKYYILHATHGPMMINNNNFDSISFTLNSSSSSSDEEKSQVSSTRSSSQLATISNILNSQNELTTTLKPKNFNIDQDIHSENPFTVQPLINSALSSSAIDSSDEDLISFSVSSSPSDQTRTRPTRQSKNEPKLKEQQTISSGSSSGVSMSRNKTKSSQRLDQLNPITSSSQNKSSLTHETNESSIGNISPIIAEEEFGKSHKQYLGSDREPINLDINYNERFYWIEPNQMHYEHLNALKRGLPYPILTVVEYLSQDDAGFSWSRQYRLAGYYTHIMLVSSLCICGLMFLLHCAAPEFAIYALQLIGLMLLLTNLLYAQLVPRGDQSLVIPFENNSLSFDFGFDYWLVLIGGCLALFVGSLLSIVSSTSPNYKLTTILDHDFDAKNGFYRHRKKRIKSEDDLAMTLQRPIEPPLKPLKNEQVADDSASTETKSSSLVDKTLNQWNHGKNEIPRRKNSADEDNKIISAKVSSTNGFPKQVHNTITANISSHL